MSCSRFANVEWPPQSLIIEAVVRFEGSVAAIIDVDMPNTFRVRPWLEAALTRPCTDGLQACVDPTIHWPWFKLRYGQVFLLTHRLWLE